MIVSLFIAMLALFALGMPVAWAMALAASIFMVGATPVPLQSAMQRMVSGVDSFPLLAIPFFVLAGNLMNSGGITDRLVTLARALVGHLTGGLAHVVVVTNMVMAGMSGSGVADAAGSGSILIPAMRKARYPAPFAAAIVGAAATIGPIIPPSIPLVIYGSVAGVSIGRLLLAGAVPGVVMGICLMVFVYLIAKREGYPAEPRAACGELARATLRAIPPLGMPVIILGGIVGGITTPTEAAVTGAIYAFLLGFVVYREIRLADIPRIVEESALTTAAIGIILAASGPIGWLLAYEQAPQKLVILFRDLGLAWWQLLVILNVAMLILGCFMDGLPILIVLTPVLMPLILGAGIDPVHFGIVFVLNLMIGMITPPVGLVMYVVCSIGKVSMMEFARNIWPFFIALVIALLLVTYIPDLATWLPNQLLPAR